MQIDPKSGSFMDFDQLVAELGVSAATLKKRLRLLECFVVGARQYGVSLGFGSIGAHRVRKLGRLSKTALGTMEDELDRAFPYWRDFPSKLKSGRKFYWERALIATYVDCCKGGVPAV